MLPTALLSPLLLFTISPLCECRLFPDWLRDDITWTSSAKRVGADRLVLSNGLVSRTFLLSPGLATVDFYSHEKKSSLLRALGPEVRSLVYASFVQLFTFEVNLLLSARR